MFGDPDREPDPQDPLFWGIPDPDPSVKVRIRILSLSNKCVERTEIMLDKTEFSKKLNF